MTDTLHIITSCTDRKRSIAGDPVRIRSIRTKKVDSRARRWWERLRKDGVRLPARDLYVGAHWAIARELPNVATKRGLESHLWVASAGYGFISADREVRSYSATFATRQPDAIAGTLTGASAREAATEWWSALSRYGRKPNTPRTIHALAESSPQSIVLVVASPEYVGAMQADLLRARDQLERPEQLIIVSSDHAARFPELATHWVPTDARLVNRVGGSMISLNASVARDILQRTKELKNLTPHRLRERYLRIANNSPDMPTYDRKALTNDEVRAAIRQMRTETTKLSRTRALQQLRQSGRKCEQSRFKRLWEEILDGA